MAKKQIATGLDLGTESYKAVQMVSNGDTTEVLTVAECAAPLNDEDMPKVVDDLFRKHGLHRKNVVTSLAGSNLITRYIAMPDLPDEKVAEAVSKEADKYIPFDISEVVLDSHKIISDKPVNDGEMQVLLVAIKRNIVEDLIKKLTGLKIQVSSVDIDEVALGNCFEMAHSSEDDGIGPLALVDIGHTKSCVNIRRGNTTVFTREFFQGAKHLRDAIGSSFDKDDSESRELLHDPGENKEILDTVLSPIIDEMAAEVNLAIDFFENQYQEEVTHAYLTGGGSLYPEIDVLFSQGIQRPTAMWNPFEHKLNVNTAKVDLETVKPCGQAYTIALGLAMRGVSA